MIYLIWIISAEIEIELREQFMKLSMNNMKVKESKKHRDVMQQIKGRYWIEGPTQESRAEIKEVGEKV